MTPRIALWAFVAALVVLHGALSWISPLGGDDWDHAIWAVRHGREGIVDWVRAFVEDHYTFSDAVGFLLARSTVVHTIVTPLVGVALLWGTFVLAARRRPRFDNWSDVLGIVLIAALIWIATPRAPLVYFHRPYVASWLYGTTLAVWFFVPLRCRIRLHGSRAIAVVAAGFLAATATRQLGLLVVTGVCYALAETPRGERTRLQWITLAAVIAGTAIGFVDHVFDFRGYKPTFDRSMEAIQRSIYDAGEVITLVLCLVLLKLVIGRLWPRHAGEGPPDTRGLLPLLAVWFGYVLFALLGPRFRHSTLFPASILLVAASYPYVRWVMTSRPLRLAMIAVALAINVIAWSIAVSEYVAYASDFRDRVAKLEAAPRDTTVTVQTYDQIRPNFWIFGEDWEEAARRQLIATVVYGLRDIELSPAFRRLESNPQLDIRFEVEGVTPEQLRAARTPEWATTLKTARDQFSIVIERLRPIVKTPFAARLVVALELDVLRGRKLLAAAYEDGRITTLAVRRKSPDDESRQMITIKPRGFAAQHPESYVVIGNRSAPIAYGRAYAVQTLTTELHAVVACDPQRCFLVDAFIPAL